MYNIEEFDEQKTKVLKYILFKKRTEQEVRNKFSKTISEELLNDIIDYFGNRIRFYPNDILQLVDIIEYLKEAKYINDIEYLEKTINNYKSLKNLSLRELKYKLMSKGVDKDSIENYIYENRDEMEEYEKRSAANILYKKQGSAEPEEIIQYLMKKGYKTENIRKAISEMEEG